MVLLPRKLTKFPRMRVEDLDMLRGKAHELDLLACFGQPTHEEADADEPVFFWDLEFPCGMVMAITFHQLTQVISVQLDAPEFRHALRHLGVEISEIATLETLHPERHAELRADIAEPTWEVWREERGSSAELLRSGLVPRDAQCLVAELSEHSDARLYAVAG